MLVRGEQASAESLNGELIRHVNDWNVLYGADGIGNVHKALRR